MQRLDGCQHVVVRLAGHVVADSVRALRVLETASPPGIYLPPDDIRMDLLTLGQGSSVCEWKGVAAYFDANLPGVDARRVAWTYSRPTLEFKPIAGYLSFYPAKAECFLAGERVRPQPGPFYGGWLTADIAGPVKGEPGSEAW